MCCVVSCGNSGAPSAGVHGIPGDGAQEVFGAATGIAVRGEGRPEGLHGVEGQSGQVGIARGLPLQDRHHGFAAEHGLAGGGEGQDRRCAPPVRTLVGFGPVDDFRGDESRGSHDQTRSGNVALPLAHGDAEVDQDRPRGRDHHVGGLDVTVDDARPVNSPDRIDHLAGQPFEVIARIGTIGRHIIPEVPPLNQLGHDECQGIIELHIDYLADPGMVNSLQGQGLAAQALAGGGSVAGFGTVGPVLVVLRQGLPQDLHGVVLAPVIPGTPDGPHGTAAKGFNQGVAPNQPTRFQIQPFKITHISIVPRLGEKDLIPGSVVSFPRGVLLPASGCHPLAYELDVR